MSLVRSPGKSVMIDKLNTDYFVRNEQILQNEQKQVTSLLKNNVAKVASFVQGQEINKLCEDLKASILERETGFKNFGPDLEKKNVLLTDGSVRDHFADETPADKKLTALRKLVEAYNEANTKAAKPGFQPIPVKAGVLDKSEDRTLEALNNFTQIEMLVLQNERAKLSAN